MKRFQVIKSNTTTRNEDGATLPMATYTLVMIEDNVTTQVVRGMTWGELKNLLMAIKSVE